MLRPGTFYRTLLKLKAKALLVVKERLKIGERITGANRSAIFAFSYNAKTQIHSYKTNYPNNS